MTEPVRGGQRASEAVANPLQANPEAWLAAIVDSSDDAIVGKTLDGTIRSWNAAAERIFGYASAEIIGRSVLTLIPPELHAEEPVIVGRLARGLRVDHFETTRLRKDGSRVEVSLSVSPIRDGGGVVIGAAKIARDITEAKRLQRAERENLEQLQELASELEQQVEEAQSLQEELEQTNEELARAVEEAEASRQNAREAQRRAEGAQQVAEEANSVKSQFLATMSHELRTPLNAIAGYVDLLDMGVRGPLNELQRKDLARIKHSEDTLLRLIDDVLSFAKLESGRVEYHYDEVRLDDFLASLETFVAPRVSEKGLTYRVAPCGTDIVVSIDRAKVEQIALNLLSNAIKFTERGLIEVDCLTDDVKIRVRVKDTGCGIPPELIDSIFEPFVQGDRSLTRTVGGTGLGLSISRQLAQEMDGDIFVESAVGGGSTFTLELPKAPAQGRRAGVLRGDGAVGCADSCE
jgi:PAS domain S-box-containing protein